MNHGFNFSNIEYLEIKADAIITKQNSAVHMKHFGSEANLLFLKVKPPRSKRTTAATLSHFPFNYCNQIQQQKHK